MLMYFQGEGEAIDCTVGMCPRTGWARMTMTLTVTVAPINIICYPRLR